MNFYIGQNLCRYPIEVGQNFKEWRSQYYNLNQWTLDTPIEVGQNLFLNNGELL